MKTRTQTVEYSQYGEALGSLERLGENLACIVLPEKDDSLEKGAEPCQRSNTERAALQGQQKHAGCQGSKGKEG